jgi:hypothetical protein
MTGAIDIKVLYNDGVFCATSSTVFSKRHNSEMIMYQLLHNGDIIYEGFDLTTLKRIKNERDKN